MIDLAWTLSADKLFIYVNTHDASTGNESDADVDPIYRIYEEDTDVPIATGTLTKLDDTDTTGFYVARIDDLLAAGFLNGKNYAIRISAIVSGITGVKVSGFIIKDPLLNIVEGTLTVKDVLRIMLSALALETSDASTLNPKFKNLAGDKNRITGTVDNDGNRTLIVFDPSE